MAAMVELLNKYEEALAKLVAEKRCIKQPAHSVIHQGDIFDDSSFSSDSSEEGGEQDMADPRLRHIVARGLQSRHQADFLGHPGPIDHPQRHRVLSQPAYHD